MNPLFKTCLLTESNRSVRSVKSRDTEGANTENTDPYSEDNDFTISRRSTDNNLSTSYSTPQLGENMMRTIVNRDPYEVYQFAKLLGNGSMVSKVCSKVLSIVWRGLHSPLQFLCPTMHSAHFIQYLLNSIFKYICFNFRVRLPW